MRLVSFEAEGRASYGAVAGGGVLDLGKYCGAEFPTLADFIAARPAAKVDVHADYPLEAVKLLPVIPQPKHIYCVALNYGGHFREVGREVPSHPAIFLRAADSLTGHMQPLIRPKVSAQLDYEGELAVIIGKRGRHVPPEDAMSYVAGYSCFNDGSVRDWQRHTSQPTPGKNFFGTGALGPWLVTKDEIADPHRLALTTRLNGQVVQQANTNEMVFQIPTFIAYVSAILPLEPGDVLATGTPAGVGFKRTPPMFLSPGDVVEVEIEHIGTLVNTVADEL